MAELRKFLFDTEFEIDHRLGKSGSVIDDPVTRQRVAAARQEGYEAGRRAAEAERERLEAETLSRMAKEIAAIGQRQVAGLAVLRQENLALALSIGRKLAASLMATQPLAEIEALVDECMRRLIGEARLVVRLHGSLLDALQGRIDQLARRAGFAGQVILLVEDEIAPGDCRVEWADGGATRNLAALEGEIDALIGRALGTLSTDGRPAG